MIAWAPTISPPPPTPWMALKAMSWPIDWLSAHSTDPTRKMTIAAWNTRLRP